MNICKVVYVYTNITSFDSFPERVWVLADSEIIAWKDLQRNVVSVTAPLVNMALRGKYESPLTKKVKGLVCAFARVCTQPTLSLFPLFLLRLNSISLFVGLCAAGNNHSLVTAAEFSRSSEPDLRPFKNPPAGRLGGLRSLLWPSQSRQAPLALEDIIRVGWAECVLCARREAQ